MEKAAQALTPERTDDAAASASMAPSPPDPEDPAAGSTATSSFPAKNGVASSPTISSNSSDLTSCAAASMSDTSLLSMTARTNSFQLQKAYLTTSSLTNVMNANESPRKPVVKTFKAIQSCHIESFTIERKMSPSRRTITNAIRQSPGFHVMFSVQIVSEISTGDNGGSGTTTAKLVPVGIAVAEPHPHQHQTRPHPHQHLSKAPQRQQHYVQRTFEQFESLHDKLQKKFPKTKLQELPTMRKKRYDNEYIESKAEELNVYMKSLLDLPEVRNDRIFRGFMDHNGDGNGNGHDNDQEPQDLACEQELLDENCNLLLENRPGTIVTVRAGQSFSVSLNLENSGDVATWQFSTKKHGIGFSATFNGETTHVYSREESQKRPVKGFYKCNTPGVCVLTWDNTYTWSKGKVLIYRAEVICRAPTAGSLTNPPSDSVANADSGVALDAEVPTPDGSAGTIASTSTSTAADDTSQGSVPPVRTSHTSTKRSSAGPNVSSSSDDFLVADCRRAGFIAQTRHHPINPRQIVSSSISALAKIIVPPRVEEHKTGLLIVERTEKFRGTKWYRKWFVLDMRRRFLRYYDSEQSSRKALAIATLNLNKKNATLAITSLDETSPTAFMFMVRAGRSCWKMCAATLTEYNEWEDAISTAILAAQVARGGTGASHEFKTAGSPTGDGHEENNAEEASSRFKSMLQMAQGTEDTGNAVVSDDDEDDDDEEATRDTDYDTSTTSNPGQDRSMHDSSRDTAKDKDLASLTASSAAAMNGPDRTALELLMAGLTSPNALSKSHRVVLLAALNTYLLLSRSASRLVVCTSLVVLYAVALCGVYKWLHQQRLHHKKRR